MGKTKLIDLITSDIKDEKIANEDFIIYPNPATDFIYLTGIENKSIEIYSVAGIKVIEEKNTNRIFLRLIWKS